MAVKQRDKGIRKRAGIAIFYYLIINLQLVYDIIGRLTPLIKWLALLADGWQATDIHDSDFSAMHY
jgi:hypothetical protein